MTDHAAERFKILIEKWRDAAVWEHDDMGNTQSGQTFDQCADDLEALLAEVARLRAHPQEELQGPAGGAREDALGKSSQSTGALIECDMADPTDAAVPLSARELDELDKRLSADAPEIRDHTRAWALVAIRQLRAASSAPPTPDPQETR
jgi:hypothetical protein